MVMKAFFNCATCVPYRYFEVLSRFKSYCDVGCRYNRGVLCKRVNIDAAACLF